jgi:hypothetical protein
MFQAGLSAQKTPLINQALHDADGHAVELFGFKRFQQFALRFRCVGNGGLGGDKKNANKFAACLFHKFAILI